MPKSIKVQLTVLFLPFADLIILIACAALGMFVGRALGLNSIVQFVMMGYFLIVGIFGIARSPWVARTENWKVFLGILRQDRNKYYPLYKTPKYKLADRRDEK